MADAERLMPGPEGKTPRFYDVDRGVKTESYITAVSRNPVPPIQPPSKGVISYSKVNDDVAVEPDGIAREPKPQASGLTEEELEVYRDDPTWKTIRMVLFVLFWLVWIALFVISILLVVLSPGCVVRSKPNWWQTAVAYNVWVPSFQDSDGDGYGDMQGLLDRLENLRKSGVQTVWPSPFLISDNFSNAVRSYSQMDPALGANQVADKAISEIHDKGMKFVINMPISTTSTEHEWFMKSSRASLPENRNYSGFYHWASKGADDYFTNYKGVYYMHEKGNKNSAILNWQNSDLRAHMFEVLSSWIDRGVDGFHLTGIEYLARTPDGSEPDWSAISDVIGDIRNHVDSYTNESTKAGGKKIALFASREEAKEKDKKQLVQSGLDTVINYELTRVEKNSEICHRTEGTIATCVHEILSDILLFHSNNPAVWPQWEFGNQYISRIASRVESRAHAELLLMLQLILPGTNNFYYGDELGMKNLPNDSRVPPQRGAMQWDDSQFAGFSSNAKIPVNSDYKNINWERQYGQEQSSLKMFSKLSKLRTRDDALMSGQTLMGKLIDGAFTVVRFYHHDNATTGNVYVGAFNFSPNTVSLPLNDLPVNEGLKKSQIVTTTSNVERYYPRQTVDFGSKTIELHKDEGVVFRYSAGK
ncbi:unnamed protein product [Cylicocyclus nassatus]|uniref:alpha-glucosidase n=1 Tax=Cylicocyclus nassatus TaxID=53992 RepID=A0AA36HC38_CYLNA|nr:unnamed protein product [Cylicocyclus nassatus]